MQKRFFLIVPVCAITLAFAACTSSVPTHDGNSLTIISSGSAAKLVTREVRVEAFSGLETSHGIRVEFTEKPSAKPEVTVTAPEDCIDHLKTEVKGGQLRIYYDFDGGEHNTKGTLVKVSAPALQTVKCSSASEVVLTDGMHVRGNLKVELTSAATFAWSGTLRVDGITDFVGSSAAELKGESLVAKNVKVILSSAAEGTLKGIQAENFEAVTLSAADLSLQGQTQTARLSASSGSNLDAADLAAERADAGGNSGATLKAPRTAQLTYSESSGASVSWKGSPKVTRR